MEGGADLMMSADGDAGRSGASSYEPTPSPMTQKILDLERQEYELQREIEEMEARDAAAAAAAATADQAGANTVASTAATATTENPYEARLLASMAAEEAALQLEITALEAAAARKSTPSPAKAFIAGMVRGGVHSALATPPRPEAGCDGELSGLTAYDVSSPEEDQRLSSSQRAGRQEPIATALADSGRSTDSQGDEPRSALQSASGVPIPSGSSPNAPKSLGRTPSPLAVPIPSMRLNFADPS